MTQQLLQEVSSKDLLKRADPKTKARSEPLETFLVGMKGNILTFSTKSGTDPANRWIQKVQVLGLARALRPVLDGYAGAKALAPIQRALKGDIKVACACPAQKYWGFQYIGTVEGYHLGGKQTHAPDIRNPKRKGSVCKHLVKVLQVLLFQGARVTSLANKQYIEPVVKQAVGGRTWKSAGS